MKFGFTRFITKNPVSAPFAPENELEKPPVPVNVIEVFGEEYLIELLAFIAFLPLPDLSTHVGTFIWSLGAVPVPKGSAPSSHRSKPPIAVGWYNTLMASPEEDVLPYAFTAVTITVTVPVNEPVKVADVEFDEEGVLVVPLSVYV